MFLYVNKKDTVVLFNKGKVVLGQAGSVQPILFTTLEIFIPAQVSLFLTILEKYCSLIRETTYNFVYNMWIFYVFVCLGWGLLFCAIRIHLPLQTDNKVHLCCS